MSMRVWATWRKHLPTCAMISPSQMWWCLIRPVPAPAQGVQADCRSRSEKCGLYRMRSGKPCQRYRHARVTWLRIGGYPRVRHLSHDPSCGDCGAVQKARTVSMPLFASRAFSGMTAIALSCAALSGCVPSNAAVGIRNLPILRWRTPWRIVTACPSP